MCTFVNLWKLLLALLTIELSVKSNHVVGGCIFCVEYKLLRSMRGLMRCPFCKSKFDFVVKIKCAKWSDQIEWKLNKHKN